MTATALKSEVPVRGNPISAEEAARLLNSGEWSILRDLGSEPRGLNDLALIETASAHDDGLSFEGVADAGRVSYLGQGHDILLPRPGLMIVRSSYQRRGQNVTSALLVLCLTDHALRHSPGRVMRERQVQSDRDALALAMTKAQLDRGDSMKHLVRARVISAEQLAATLNMGGWTVTGGRLARRSGHTYPGGVVSSVIALGSMLSIQLENGRLLVPVGEIRRPKGSAIVMHNLIDTFQQRRKSQGSGHRQLPEYVCGLEFINFELQNAEAAAARNAKN